MADRDVDADAPTERWSGRVDGWAVTRHDLPAVTEPTTSLAPGLADVTPG